MNGENMKKNTGLFFVDFIIADMKKRIINNEVEKCN